MTNSNNNIFILMGNKNDGKTTAANYIDSVLKNPSIIVDPAKEFGKKDYRIKCHTIREVEYYLNNDSWKKALYTANMQLIYRPTLLDTKTDVNLLCQELLNYRNLTIVFDEMDLYADRWLTKKDAIYKLVFLSRNLNHNIIIVSKKPSELAGIIKSMFDYIFVSKLEANNDLEFFKKHGGDDLVRDIKSLDYREFLIIGRREFRQKFKLDSKIAKILQ